MLHLRTLSLVVAILLPACADASSGDDAATTAADREAETASPLATGKADGQSFVGLYVTHAKTHKEGDITALSLLAPSGKPGISQAAAYIRSRCYHSACSLELPETDTYDTYTSSSGKTYVRFYAQVVTRNANGEIDATPAVADVYEIKATSSGIKLRKSYSTRWVTLYKTSEAALCKTDKGTWDGGSCACPGNVPNTFAAHIWVPGAGGCIATPGASESACDDSNGSWMDDDGSMIGTYCLCGLGRYNDASGACADI